MQFVEYLNLPNCIRLSNGEVEVVVTTEVGPRILSYAFVGGENILGLHPNARVETALGEFKPYGGHRLWIAPEHMPNSYVPDNSPVEYHYNLKENSIRLVQPIDEITRTQKELLVRLDATGSGLSIDHTITNRGTVAVEMACWALTVMRAGGVCEIPNEQWESYGTETLLPTRSLALWPYTDLSDSRWQFDKEFIRLRVDGAKSEPQKIGVLNKRGWVGYRLQDQQFVKRFAYDEEAVYPDLNSNTEVYTAGDFIEVETLAPLRTLNSGESSEHSERWELTSTRT
ncbi:MAG: hypothetical protein PSX80_15965 [bacterium]|nr:hypothetical protein [bacterium]